MTEETACLEMTDQSNSKTTACPWIHIQMLGLPLNNVHV